MSINAIKNLLSEYNLQKTSNNVLSKRDKRKQREDCGMYLPSDGSFHHRLDDSTPAYLTYDNMSHSFIVEKTEYIPYKALFETVSNDNFSHKSEDYPEIVTSTFVENEMATVIEKSVESSICSDVYHLLERGCLDFVEYFCSHKDPLRAFGRIAPNIYFYPHDIERYLRHADPEHIEKEKKEFEERLSVSKKVAKNLRYLEDDSTLSDKELEDAILTNIYKLYDKDYKKARVWAKEKSGFGIGGDISILEEDWESMQMSWEIIKSKHPRIFVSSRFIPLCYANDEEESAKWEKITRSFIDMFFKSQYLESVFLKLFNLIYKSFYAKPVTD